MRVLSKTVSWNRWKQSRALQALSISLRKLCISNTVKPLLIKYPVLRQITSMTFLQSSVSRQHVIILLKSIDPRHFVRCCRWLFFRDCFDLE